MENGGGDGFNEFLMDICLCSRIRSYLLTTKKVLVAVHKRHVPFIPYLYYPCSSLSSTQFQPNVMNFYLPVRYTSSSHRKCWKSCSNNLVNVLMAGTLKIYIGP